MEAKEIIKYKMKLNNSKINRKIYQINKIIYNSKNKIILKIKMNININMTISSNNNNNYITNYNNKLNNKNNSNKLSLINIKNW